MNTLPRTAGTFQTEAKTCSKKGKGTNRNWGEKSKLQLCNFKYNYGWILKTVNKWSQTTQDNVNIILPACITNF